MSFAINPDNGSIYPCEDFSTMPANPGDPNKIVTGATLFVNPANGSIAFNTAVIFTLMIPTADPHVLGQLWNNAGVVTVSAG